MTSSTAVRRAYRMATALSVALVLGVASGAPGWAKSGAVVPAKASPYGVSLTEMAAAVAPFTFSGNDPAHYPDTPFQVLYVDGFDVEIIDGGLVATGAKTFTVEPGTSFYLPIFNVNDAPPVLGVFPTSAADAPFYFFDQSQVGAQDFEIVVDGTSTPIGPSFLAGPVPIAGFEGTNVITLGAFVHPLSAGNHTVEIHGGAFGDLIAATYGLSFLVEHITYTVVVQP